MNSKSQMSNAKIKSVFVWGLSIFVTLTVVSTAIAQIAYTDSSYSMFKGNIVDASTKSPVKALVTFESMPYGSTIGVLSGSMVEIPMTKRTDYVITVEAEGYSSYVATVKASEVLNPEEHTIELVPREVRSLIRLEKLIFAQGKATIAENSYGELDDLVAMLQQSRDMVIQLEGHTDFRGNARENMKLSERRVEAVKDYLVSKGVNKNRIKTVAYGGEKPLTTSNDAESRSKNRRVEVRILNN